MRLTVNISELRKKLLKGINPEWSDARENEKRKKERNRLDMVRKANIQPTVVPEGKEGERERWTMFSEIAWELSGTESVTGKGRTLWMLRSLNKGNFTLGCVLNCRKSQEAVFKKARLPTDAAVKLRAEQWAHQEMTGQRKGEPRVLCSVNVSSKKQS